EGEYAGDRGLMPLDVGRRALDYLVAHSGTRRNLEVDFFGGEPLLNWDVVVALTAYGRRLEADSGKRFRFTLTTNGTLLREDMFDFINREMSNVVLSLDGRRRVHDAMRPDRGGKGTYDRVLPRFKALVDSRGGRDYYIRGTFTRENLDFAQDVLHMADLGFKELSIEPVVAPADAPYALRMEDLPILFQQYDLLAAEMRKRSREGRGFNFYHFMVDLTGGPCGAKRVSGCGVGAEYLAVTPEGHLYPCHQFVGEQGFRLGDVFSGIARDAPHEQFLKANLYGRDICRDCFAKFYCSGGCAANAHHFSGDIMGGYELGCALMRKRVECAIMLKAAEADA
ncbi:MAG: thioether cross-link-forming SCIFF peptide maturase, partial [Clostridiales bacterium]|nr:thioether cross-link-forming SCIFF peptide maturase [Clostridiales bacterium]